MSPVRQIGACHRCPVPGPAPRGSGRPLALIARMTRPGNWLTGRQRRAGRYWRPPRFRLRQELVSSATGALAGLPLQPSDYRVCPRRRRRLRQLLSDPRPLSGAPSGKRRGEPDAAPESYDGALGRRGGGGSVPRGWLRLGVMGLDSGRRPLPSRRAGVVGRVGCF